MTTVLYMFWTGFGGSITPVTVVPIVAARLPARANATAIPSRINAAQLPTRANAVQFTPREG